jgi:phytoene dehydrogenase-like protein
VHHQGVARLPRGAGPLATALEAALLRAGGSVEYDTPVHRILRRRGAVSGVRVGPPGAARDVPARAVLSTASPAVTFEELLHAEGEAPAGYPPLRTGFVTALSALLVRAPLAHLPSAPHCPVLYHGGSDPEEAGWDLQRSRPEMLALALSLLPAAGGNPAQAVIYAPAPYSRPDFWEAPLESRPGGEYRSLAGYRQLKAELGAILLARAATALPELRGAAVPPEAVATPLTLERRTGNTGGSCWGWAPLPEQCGVHRPGPRTPFQGLFMAGQWTFPGGCVAGALLSARSAARAMLAHLGGDPATSGRPTGYHPQ